MNNVGRVEEVQRAQLVVQDDLYVLLGQLRLGNGVKQLLEVGLHVLKHQVNVSQVLDINGQVFLSSIVIALSRLLPRRCSLFLHDGLIFILLVDHVLGQDHI